MAEQIFAIILGVALAAAVLQIVFLLVRAAWRARKASAGEEDVHEGRNALDALPYVPSGELFPPQERLLQRLISQKSAALSVICPDPDAPHATGLGATRVALTFASRQGHLYRAIHFLAADSPRRLTHGLAALAGPAALDLEAYTEALSDEARADAVIDALRQESGWLLIVDGADDPEAVEAVEALLRPLLPAVFRREAGGRVLVTSRSPEWSQRGTHFFLEAPKPAVAADFLLQRTAKERQHQPGDPEAAAAVADALQCWPLGLHLAAAWISAQGKSFTDYRQRLQESELRGPVALNLAALSPPAQDTARLLAVLAPGMIPRLIISRYAALLAEEVKGRDGEPRQILEALQRLGLGYVQEAELGEEEPAGEDLGAEAFDREAFLMHPHVQAEIRATFGPGDETLWLGTATEVLSHLLPDPPWDPAAWPEWEAFLPHALRVAEAVLERSSDETDVMGETGETGETDKADATDATGGTGAATASLFDQLALFFRARGLFEEAVPLARRAVELDPSPWLRITLAALHSDLERFPEAVALGRQAREALLADPQSHPLEIARVSGHLASALSDAGEFEEAEQLLREALLTLRRELEADPYDVADALSALATALEGQGRLQEALPLREEALALFDDGLGSEAREARWEREDLEALREKIWKAEAG